MLLVAGSDGLNVVKNSLQLVEANVASVMSAVRLQILFYLVILVEPKSEMRMWLSGLDTHSVALGVNWLQVDVVSEA